MKVYFYVRAYESSQKASYPHQAIALAEGLEKLDVAFASNVPAYFDPHRNDYLLQQQFSPDEADIHVYEITYFKSHPAYAVNSSKINVLFDPYEGMVNDFKRTVYRHFGLVLKNNFLEQYEQVFPHVRPWAYGLTNRMLNYTNRHAENMQEPIILNTYRVPHNLRKLAIDSLTPILEPKFPTVNYITDSLQDGQEPDFSATDKKYWEITGRRHHPAYFEALSKALMVYAFGGFMHLKPYGWNDVSRFTRQWYKLRDVMDRLMGSDRSRNYYIYQFESWRLWETMYSNTCPILLDFDSWGFRLPVNPVNGEHYIGIKGLDFEGAARKILSMSIEEIQQIGRSGRQWAGEHYSPEVVAKRFLSYIKELKK